MRYDKSVHPFIPVLISALLCAPSCGGPGSSAAKAPAPARIDNPVKETDLTTVTLTAEAVARLGVETAKAGVSSVPRTLRLGGEIVARPGGRAAVTAPSAGVVLAPKDRPLPLAGARVARGEAVLRFLPLPADKDLTAARNDLAVKEAQLEAASAKARRAADLLQDKAASEKALEEAKAELAAAEAAAKAARARWQLLGAGPENAPVDDLSTLALVSPVAGVLERLGVAAGQTVPAGAVLFEAADVDPVWVRVPVYVGDLASVEPRAAAEVRPFGRPAEAAPLSASPVAGPPLSDAGSASSDLYYELRNRDGALRLGQRVAVTLIAKGAEEALAVPAAAVLYDMQGGTWVYVRSAPTVFVRTRVDVRHTVGGLAVLGRGLAAGAEVVSAGAAELFGTEFGAGK
ncbi:MAG TPA: efflux RND transporter periplasmic adaptor subunit [Candidatus Aminicenantes bacterium]|nr:efflux RND transporter periplasmic adaptor subunit [Candidatus Aminicenantes bacterium]